jgi:2-dehydropantoate 2-reductase
MELTIVGAGAIGGTIGAYLARAGETVTLVDRDLDHVRAMQDRGLQIRGYENFTTPVRAITPDRLGGPLDVVLLAVKAQHTGDAVRAIEAYLSPESSVVSLQNGLCEQIIAGLIGRQRTVGCFVNFSADYLEPGVIMYAGPDSLYLGELDGEMTERILALQTSLASWGDVTLTNNIWGYLWGKMGYANMLFATALADETMADVIDRYRSLMVELAAEIYETAALEGVKVEAFDDVQPGLFYPREHRNAAAIQKSLDALVARRRSNQKVKSGIWRDLAVRRRKTEVDQQIGLAAEIGARHDLPMPLTRKLVELIHDLENGNRQMSWANLDELDALRSA